MEEGGGRSEPGEPKPGARRAEVEEGSARSEAGRTDVFPSVESPPIAEIFEWASDAESGALRFLRRPQLRALETYWYLRLIEGTPHIFTLYQRLFPEPVD